MSAQIAAPAAVPARYRGVWVRTLLEAPGVHDTTTYVRWMQTSRWHADLRVPESARGNPTETVHLAQQLGFCGETDVSTTDHEVCTWHRRLDFQPPSLTPDAGTMVFKTADQVIEEGVHGKYLEVWERLPGSEGRAIALAGQTTHGQDSGERLLVAGNYLMRVRPRAAPWPPHTAAGTPLSALVALHPDHAQAWLDFEISFGVWDGSTYVIERSSLPVLEGQRIPLQIRRKGDQASMLVGAAPSQWQVLDWLD